MDQGLLESSTLVEFQFGKVKSSKPWHLFRREDWPCIDDRENELDLSDLVLIDQKLSARTEMDPSKVPEYTRLDCSKRRPWDMRHYGQYFDAETLNEHRVVERRYREVSIAGLMASRGICLIYPWMGLIYP